MCDDRTAEFLSLAKSLPQERLQAKPASISSHGGMMSQTEMSPYAGRYGAGHYGAGGAAAAKNPAHQELRDFHRTASGISRDIAATSHMLSELTQLVKTKSLFVMDNDSYAARVNSLVMKIKSNIENLNGRLDDANHTIQSQKRRMGRQAGQEAFNLVGQLKQEFVQATAGFKRVLQERTESMREATDQKRQVYGGNVDFVSLDNKPPVYSGGGGGGGGIGGGGTFPTLDLTSGMSTGEPTGSLLPRPHGVDASSGGGALYSTPELRLRRSPSDFSGPLTPLDMQRMEQEAGQQLQLIPDQTYLRERADAMSTVETNIVELGTIFNKLAVMVSEHREMVQRVEDNVEEANTHLNLSMDALTDTLTNLRTNRALFMKLFGVVVSFIIIFIIFFA